MLHSVYLSKILLERLMKRPQRSAIIFTSGTGAYFPLPGGLTNGASKAMVSNWGKSLHYEVGHQVEVLVWNPMGIKTPVIGHSTYFSCLFISPIAAVTSMLKSLGHTAITEGNFKHETMTWLLSWIYHTPCFLMALARKFPNKKEIEQDLVVD